MGASSGWAGLPSLALMAALKSPRHIPGTGLLSQDASPV